MEVEKYLRSIHSYRYLFIKIITFAFIIFTLFAAFSPHHFVSRPTTQLHVMITYFQINISEFFHSCWNLGSSDSPVSQKVSWHEIDEVFAHSSHPELVSPL